MSASTVVLEIRKRLGISRMKLAKRLDLKSQNIIWLYEKQKRFPSRITWNKLIDIAKEVDIDVTTEMMRN